MYGFHILSIVYQFNPKTIININAINRSTFESTILSILFNLTCSLFVPF